MGPVLSTLILILKLFFYIISGYYFYQTLKVLADFKRNRIWKIVSMVSSCILCTMIIFPRDMFNITLELIWFLVLMLVACKGNFLQKLAPIAILFPIIISLNFLILDMPVQLSAIIGEYPLFDVVAELSDGLLHILFWYLIQKCFQNKLERIKKLFDIRTWFLIDIICFASLVSITTCIYYTPNDTYKIWFCAFSCLITNISVLYLCEYFSNSICMDMERKNLKLQQEYYQALEQNQTDIRKLRHDMNHHLSVIKILVDSGDLEQAKSYFQETETMLKIHNRVFCKDSIVNAVLNNKYNVAFQSNIDCFFHIDLSNSLDIDSISLCSLFSNTIDNAIEACNLIPDKSLRHITVRARTTENGYFSYEITNSKQNPILIKNGIYQSSKEDSKSHGLGLINIQDIVKKYNGTLDIKYTADSFSLVVFIRL